MVFEDHALELLQRGEAEYQKAIDSYSNYEIISTDSASAASSSSASNGESNDNDESSASILTAKQLRQFIEENLRSQDVSEEDHGKRFISNDDDYFGTTITTPADHAEGMAGRNSSSRSRRKRSRSLATSSERMESECSEINYDEEDVHEVYVWYEEADSDAPTMETVNEDEPREFGGDDEVSYDVEFTDVTYL